MNNTWGMVKKNLLTHLTMGVLCALVTFVGNAWLGTALGAIIYFTFLILQYGDGCDRGERACTLRDTIEKMKKDGKTPDERMLAQTFDRSFAAKAFVISSLPFALLAIVNLICANPNTVSETALGTVTRIVFFPAAWITRLFTEKVGIDLTGAIQAADGVFASVTRAGVALETALRNLSGIGEYAVAYDLGYLTVMRALYIPAAFLSPLFMMIGYLRGPKLREKQLADIAKGTRKKAKKLKVFGKPKQKKQIRPEV